MLPAAALAISLWITACIDGTLHGAPTMLCHEFQIRHYAGEKAAEKCNAAVREGSAVDEWLASMKPYNIFPHVAALRCGPAEADGSDI